MEYFYNPGARFIAVIIRNKSHVHFEQPFGLMIPGIFIVSLVN